MGVEIKLLTHLRTGLLDCEKPERERQSNRSMSFVLAVELELSTRSAMADILTCRWHPTTIVLIGFPAQSYTTGRHDK